MDAMRRLLLRLLEEYPGSEVVPGHAGWNAIEFRREGRLVARVLPKRGLVKVKNVRPDARLGDYGPEIDLRQRDREWVCVLHPSGAPRELLDCIEDAVEGVGRGLGRRGR